VQEARDAPALDVLSPSVEVGHDEHFVVRHDAPRPPRYAPCRPRSPSVRRHRPCLLRPRSPALRRARPLRSVSRSHDHAMRIAPGTSILQGE
jgi:hypothetical protein